MERKQTPKDLLDLAQRDPIVYACLKLWEAGDLTWEEALLHAVISLAKQKADLEALLLKAVENNPSPVRFDVNKTQPDIQEQ